MRSYQKVDKIIQSYQESLSYPVKSDGLKQAIYFTVSHLFDSTLTVGEIKDHCHINANNFSTRFALETGFTPKSFILYHRIEVSKILLQQTEVTVTSIAISIGFSSLSSYDNAFRRSEGLQPTVWVELQAETSQNI